MSNSKKLQDGDSSVEEIEEVPYAPQVTKSQKNSQLQKSGNKRQKKKSKKDEGVKVRMLNYDQHFKKDFREEKEIISNPDSAIENEKIQNELEEAENKDRIDLEFRMTDE